VVVPIEAGDGWRYDEHIMRNGRSSHFNGINMMGIELDMMGIQCEYNDTMGGNIISTICLMGFLGVSPLVLSNMVG